MELEYFQIEVVVCENLSNITQPRHRATVGRGIELVATSLGEKSSCHCYLPFWTSFKSLTRMWKVPDLLSFSQDFDRILSILNNLHEIYTDEDGPAIVFSCESGKGRTTTGMAIAALIYCNKKVRVHFIFPQQLLFTSFLQSNYMILGSLRNRTAGRLKTAEWRNWCSARLCIPNLTRQLLVILPCWVFQPSCCVNPLLLEREKGKQLHRPIKLIAKSFRALWYFFNE